MTKYEQIYKHAFQKYREYPHPISKDPIHLKAVFIFLMSKGLLSINVKKGLRPQVIRSWFELEDRLLSFPGWDTLKKASKDLKLEEERLMFHETLLRTLFDLGYITALFSS